MSCGMNSQNGAGVTSWFSLQQVCPKDPTTLIAWAKFDEVTGVLTNSATFAIPPSGSWTADATTLAGDPVCVALETDNQLSVAEAAQWNFQHKTRNDSILLAPPLRKLIFLRAGTAWKMQIPIHLDSLTTNIQLSFRNNAATRGDAQGTVPVIEFEGSFAAGDHVLEVTLLHLEQTTIGLRMQLNDGNTSYFAFDWIVVD